MRTELLTTRRRIVASTLAAAGVATGLAAPAIGQRARVLRYGSMLPADSIYHRACVMFGDELAKLSSGKLKIEVYPELAAWYDPRDDVVGADRIVANDHGGVGVVFQVHEAARCVHAAATSFRRPID